MKRIALTLLLVASELTLRAAYTVYPIPQSLSAEGTPVVFEGTVTVTADAAIDAATLDRAREVLEENGLTCRFADAPADGDVLLALSVDGTLNGDSQHRFDHHRITLADEQGRTVLRIVGAHTDAVFFGLATVEQLLEQREDGRLTPLTIDDWADQQMRGIVEGYYGYPYTIDVCSDLMEWGKRYKMNTFIYGPKSDPYHLGYWKDDYPTKVSERDAAAGLITQDDLRRLAGVSRATKVNLIWAAHPAMSNAIDLSTEQGTLRGAQDLLRKFDHLHSLGVRQFGIFLDDISVANGVRDCERHALLLRSVQDSLETRYNTAAAAPADTVRPLNFVPTPYALNFASADDLKTYFAAISTIQPYITVYFTGSGVWSNISESDYRTMQNYLGRPVAMWWNFPCNDNNDRNIYLMDVNSYYKTDATLQSSLGIACNPMAQGEASKVTLFGVMDYCWNVKAFSSTANWQHAFDAVVRDDTLAAAFKAFAPYAMQNEPSTLGTLISNWQKSPTATNTTKLRNTLTTLRADCATLQGLATSDDGCDRRLYTEIHFWIDKLHDMCDIALSLMDVSAIEDDCERWDALLPLMDRYEQLGKSADYTVVQRENAGLNFNTSSGIVTPSNKYLMPFVKTLAEQAMHVDTPRDGIAVVSSVTLANSSVYSGKATNVADGDYGTYVWMSSYQALGDCYTLTLQDATPIYDIRVVLMEGDRMTEAEVQTSADKRTWTTVGAVVPADLKHYGDIDAYYKDITCDGTKARYVRLRLSKPDTSKWFKLAEIEVNKHSSKGFVAAKDYSGKAIKALYDNDLATSFTPSLGAVTYYFNLDLMTPRQVFIYQDPAKIRDVAADRIPTVCLSADGKVWQDTTLLDRSVVVRDLSAFDGKPYALKINSSIYVKPKLHEICESSAPYNSLEAVVEAPENLEVRLDSGTLVVTAQKNIRVLSLRALDGRLVATLKPRAKEVRLPQPPAGTYVITATMPGTPATAKLTVF